MWLMNCRLISVMVHYSKYPEYEARPPSAFKASIGPRSSLSQFFAKAASAGGESQTKMKGFNP